MLKIGTYKRMNRIVICTDEFLRYLEKHRIEDEHIRTLENELLLNPQKGDLIVGTGGVRKIRLAKAGSGKRSGFRVLYIDIPRFELIYLLLIYSKSSQDNLTEDQKRFLKKLSENIGQELK